MPTDFHPFLVHFPLAWLPLLAIWGCLETLRSKSGLGVRPGGQGVARSVLGRFEGALGLALLGTILAAATGDAALSRYALEGSARELAEWHGRLGGWVPWLLGTALGGRLALVLRARSQTRSDSGGLPWGVLRWGTTAVLLLATLTALAAGFAGGRLVHEYGVTGATAPAAEPQRVAPDVYRAR